LSSLADHAALGSQDRSKEKGAEPIDEEVLLQFIIDEIEAANEEDSIRSNAPIVEIDEEIRDYDEEEMLALIRGSIAVLDAHDDGEDEDLLKLEREIDNATGPNQNDAPSVLGRAIKRAAAKVANAAHVAETKAKKTASHAANSANSAKAKAKKGAVKAANSVGDAKERALMKLSAKKRRAEAKRQEVLAQLRLLTKRKTTSGGASTKSERRKRKELKQMFQHLSDKFKRSSTVEINNEGQESGSNRRGSVVDESLLLELILEEIREEDYQDDPQNDAGSVAGAEIDDIGDILDENETEEMLALLRETISSLEDEEDDDDDDFAEADELVLGIEGTSHNETEPASQSVLGRAFGRLTTKITSGQKAVVHSIGSATDGAKKKVVGAAHSVGSQISVEEQRSRAKRQQLKATLQSFASATAQKTSDGINRGAKKTTGAINRSGLQKMFRDASGKLSMDKGAAKAKKEALEASLAAAEAKAAHARAEAFGAKLNAAQSLAKDLRGSLEVAQLQENKLKEAQLAKSSEAEKRVMDLQEQLDATELSLEVSRVLAHMAAGEASVEVSEDVKRAALVAAAEKSAVDAKMALTNAALAAMEVEKMEASEEASRAALELASEKEAAAASVAIAHAAAMATELEMMALKEKASSEVLLARKRAAQEVAATKVKTAAEIAKAQTKASTAELEARSEASAARARADAEIAAAKEAAEAEVAAARAARAAAELELEHAKLTVDDLNGALATSKESAAELKRISADAAAALGYKTNDSASMDEITALMKAIELEMEESGVADASEQTKLAEENEGLPDFSGRIHENDDEPRGEEEIEAEEAEMLLLLHRCFLSALQADEDGEGAENDDCETNAVRSTASELVLDRAFQRVSTSQSSTAAGVVVSEKKKVSDTPKDAARESRHSSAAEVVAEAQPEWVGRAQCAGCRKQGHQTWYPVPPPEKLRIELLEPGRGEKRAPYLCNACDQTNKLQLARERERERTAADPLMRTPARKKGELPKMSVR
jgi:hypothetical protein